MTLFAEAPLRTIEFGMVTTDASFPGPGERGGGRGQPGSRADDARGGEGRRRRGARPAEVQGPQGRCVPSRPRRAEALGLLTHTALSDRRAELGWKCIHP